METAGALIDNAPAETSSCTVAPYYRSGTIMCTEGCSVIVSNAIDAVS
jgi:hypothetical protein